MSPLCPGEVAPAVRVPCFDPRVATLGTQFLLHMGLGAGAPKHGFVLYTVHKIAANPEGRSVM